MIIIFYSIPTVLIVLAIAVAWVLADTAYGGLAAAAAVVIDYLPIVGAVLLVALLAYSIFYGIRNESFWYGFAMMISWSKSIFLMLIGVEIFLEIIVTSGGPIQAFFLGTLGLLVAVGIPMFELYTTTCAWETAKDDDSLTMPFVQAGIVYVILILIAIFG